MPYISTKTNVKITPEQELSIKTKLGKAIEAFPGKTERWLMLSFSDGARLWFAGDDSACAYISVKLLGKADDRAYDKMTALVTEIVSDELRIEPSRIYVKYEEIDHWGWNGSNF